MQPPVTRSPRAQRTRDALVGAGFDLLAVKPIDAIPIDEVVARASVAKGSFFNHFADKQAFAAALAAEVRRDLEEKVNRANAQISDPVERIATGLRICARFAVDDPKRTAVLLRSSNGAVDPAHPLNKGVAQDFAAASEAGLIHAAARSGGVLYWLGICQALMAYLIEPGRLPDDARKQTSAMLALGLAGLGIDAASADAIAQRTILVD